MLVGVMSDTHGYLDPRVETAFAGAEAILHAGDVGAASVLEGLRRLAPVYAVAGNNDLHLAELCLPERIDLELAGVGIHLVHRLLDASPAPGTAVVVYGHSHVAVCEQRNGVLYLNPGAAGRRGFHRELSVALLDVDAGAVRATLKPLGPRPPAAVRGGRLRSIE